MDQINQHVDLIADRALLEERESLTLLRWRYNTSFWVMESLTPLSIFNKLKIMIKLSDVMVTANTQSTTWKEALYDK